MANTYETLEGTFYWTKIVDPEETPFKDKNGDFKWVWKTMFRPNAESLMKVMDLQSKGVKNMLKKDELGYYTNFNRPVKDSRGKSLQPPKAYKADGTTPLTESIGNGSKGKLVLELYEHKTPTGGKASAARLYSLTITELVVYSGSSDDGKSDENGGRPPF